MLVLYTVQSVDGLITAQLRPGLGRDQQTSCQASIYYSATVLNTVIFSEHKEIYSGILPKIRDTFHKRQHYTFNFGFYFRKSFIGAMPRQRMSSDSSLIVLAVIVLKETVPLHFIPRCIGFSKCVTFSKIMYIQSDKLLVLSAQTQATSLTKN